MWRNGEMLLQCIALGKGLRDEAFFMPEGRVFGYNQ